MTGSSKQQGRGTGTRTPEPPVVELVVLTRHPEHYRLVNEADGTQWRHRDGHWNRVTEASGSSETPLTKRDRDRAAMTAAVREWLPESVVVTGEDGAEADTVTMGEVVTSFQNWLLWAGEEGREEPPGSKALLREVLTEQVTATGVRYDRMRKVYVGIRLR
jgi:hypothetical protein